MWSRSLWTLGVIVSLLIATSAGCTAGPRSEPTPCVSDDHVVFEPGGERFDLCYPRSELPVGHIDNETLPANEIWVNGKLPSSGPWGSGEGPADFYLHIENLGPTSTTGSAGIAYSSNWGWSNPKEGTWSWDGDCDVTLGEPVGRLTFQCELRRSTYHSSGTDPDPGVAALELTGDAPLPVGWVAATHLATYRIGGGATAEGMVPVRLPNWYDLAFIVRLEDGRKLNLWLGDETEAPGASLYDREWTRAQVNFGVCQTDVDAETWTGTFRCPGSSEYESMAPATLDLTLEPLTP